MSDERLGNLRAAAEEVRHAATVAECVDEIDAGRAELLAARAEAARLQAELTAAKKVARTIHYALTYMIDVRKIVCEHTFPGPADSCAKCIADAALELKP